MADMQMRGYVLLSGADYLRKTVGEQKAAGVLDRLSPPVRESLRTAKEATWCPVGHIGELYTAIAGLSNGDEARAQADLIACGKYTAREASNTFLRLFMKMLTPNLFAKKLPDIWSRDCTGGKILVEVRDDRIKNRLLEMEGFDHVAPTAAGYVTFALETMGKSVTKTEVHGWSLTKPCQPDCWFEVHWKT